MGLLKNNLINLSQTSQFSMGNDISDINHDGLVDIITLDMLPEDEKVLKNSLGEINYNSLVRRKSLGYNYQFPRNHLQINTGVDKFKLVFFHEYQPLIGVGLLFLRILITMDTKIWSFLMEFIEDQMMQTTLNTSPLNK